MNVGQTIEDSRGRTWRLEMATTVVSDEQLRLLLDGFTAEVGDMLDVPVIPTGVIQKGAQRFGNVCFKRVA